jgi:LPS export ABC transporter protein LptC
MITFCVFAGSCERKLDTIKNADILSLPSITVKNSFTIYNDSGKVQLIMTFPLMEAYDNDESPYYEFKQGIKVVYFEGKKDTVASVISKYARYTEKKRLWELKDSVVVHNDNNDMLETEQLFWDQEKDQIFTERAVKLTNEDQVVIGTGFESDSKLNRRRIKNVTATLYLKNE